MTGKLDLGECMSLNAGNFQLTVYLSPVETPPIYNDGYLCLFNLESDKLRCLAVPAQNSSVHDFAGQSLHCSII